MQYTIYALDIYFNTWHIVSIIYFFIMYFYNYIVLTKICRYYKY